MNAPALPRTLIIGGANLDVAGTSKHRLIPGDSNPGTIRTSAGGVGRNIAENMARLGFQCSLLTALGQDLGQQLICQACTNAGVDIANILIKPECATGSYIAVNNQLGALLAAVNDMAIVKQITPAWLSEQQSLIATHEQIITEANLEEETLIWIAAHRQGRPLMVDAVSAPKAVKLKTILNDIELLKVNRDEAAAILGKQAADADLAKMLHEDKGVKQVLLSQGPQGALFCDQYGMTHKSALKGSNVCDTGAGDALLAGFITAQHWLKNAGEQLEFAIACATFTLNSLHSVNPLISVETIRNTFLNHLPNGAWRK